MAKVAVTLTLAVVGVLLALAAAKRSHAILAQKGCKSADAPLCCQSKNNTCRVYGKRVNNADSKTCFCDSDCKDLGDCCLDYEEVCKPVDCELSDWGHYGECSTRCGFGMKERTKRVLTEPKNNGKPCGTRRERLVCYGNNCKVPRAPEEGLAVLHETGKIIPATYGTWRGDRLYNPFKDIRSNLFHHYKSNSIITRPTYCARYEISSARKSCGTTFFADWAPRMKEGSTVCVECQQLAMHRNLGVRCRGHGIYMRETRWNAVTVPGCHGEWVLKTRHEECRCKPDEELSFILL